MSDGHQVLTTFLWLFHICVILSDQSWTDSIFPNITKFQWPSGCESSDWLAAMLLTNLFIKHDRHSPLSDAGEIVFVTRRYCQLRGPSGHCRLQCCKCPIVRGGGWSRASHWRTEGSTYTTTDPSVAGREKLFQNTTPPWTLSRSDHAHSNPGQP